ncbi:MAG TPA: biotin--[acetyl-CoA-carboxylase] ligase [Chitinophagaceae bacterium]|nr:biotin--[acetyl-CoA-carboxylase] ligase [Chitinophagaceae bacterium]
MPFQPYPFIVLQSVESTNNYAMAQVHAGMAKHGSAYLALEQTAGKGQRGKRWESARGENLTMSMVLQPHHLLLSEQFLLSARVALACFDLVSRLVPGQVSIKWPNDIYINDRKAGGILIENIIHGNTWLYSIVGTGINVNQDGFPDFLVNAVSLKQTTGITYDVPGLASQLYNLVLSRYNSAVSPNDLLKEYNSQLYQLHNTVRLKKNNIVFAVKIKGVNRNGLLVGETGIEEEFSAGEVEWVK